MILYCNYICIYEYFKNANVTNELWKGAVVNQNACKRAKSIETSPLRTSSTTYRINSQFFKTAL